MQPQQQRNNRRVLLIIVGFVVLVLGLIIITSKVSGGPVNPNGDRNVEGDMGKTFAVTYKYADLYKIIEENDEILRNIQEDLLLFARTTRPELADSKKLVGFTITKQLPKEGENSVFIGRYYGVADEIRLAISPQGRGVYTLSITNQKDKTNIDRFLRMNGPRNKYISTLPIQAGRYSIRYQLAEDRIVATFYDGYTVQDIEAVIASLSEGLGPNYSSEVVFSVNRIGIMGLEAIRQNLSTPFNY